MSSSHFDKFLCELKKVYANSKVLPISETFKFVEFPFRRFNFKSEIILQMYLSMLSLALSFKIAYGTGFC